MAIYTRFGEPCEFIEARLAPQWFERRRGENKIHFRKPKQTKQTIEIEETVAWLVKAKATDGRLVCYGKWVEMIGFRADEGLRELHQVFEAILPADELDKFHRWNKKDGPEATTLWPLLDTKEVA